MIYPPGVTRSTTEDQHGAPTVGAAMTSPIPRSSQRDDQVRTVVQYLINRSAAEKADITQLLVTIG